MDKFIVEYMHSTMDDSLIGKEGFFADDKYDLVDRLSSENPASLVQDSKSSNSIDYTN